MTTTTVTIIIVTGIVVMATVILCLVSQGLVSGRESLSPTSRSVYQVCPRVYRVQDVCRTGSVLHWSTYNCHFLVFVGASHHVAVNGAPSGEVRSGAHVCMCVCAVGLIGVNNK